MGSHAGNNEPIDVGGLVLLPGMADLRTLHEPPRRGRAETGSRHAATGGYMDVYAVG